MGKHWPNWQVRIYAISYDLVKYQDHITVQYELQVTYIGVYSVLSTRFQFMAQIITNIKVSSTIASRLYSHVFIIYAALCNRTVTVYSLKRSIVPSCSFVHCQTECVWVSLAM